MTVNRAYVSNNISEKIQITITANDTINPIVESTKTPLSLAYVNQTVYLFATVSDNVQVDTCWANITQWIICAPIVNHDADIGCAHDSIGVDINDWFDGSLPDVNSAVTARTAVALPVQSRTVC